MTISSYKLSAVSKTAANEHHSDALYSANKLWLEDLEYSGPGSFAEN